MSKPKRKWPLPIMTEVEWDDANSNARWQDLGEMKNNHHVALCKSVGYLLKRDKKEILLVQTQAPEGDGAGVISIPIGFVRRVRRIKG